MADDWQGFESWVRSSQHGLLRSAYLLTGDIQHAEDLVQDALVKVASRWDRLRGENVDGYVRRIMYHDYVSWWRRHKSTLSRFTRSAHTIDHSDAVAQRQAVQRALDRLTPKQRVVVVLRFFEDLSERETADILGVHVGTVKSQTSAALARLRALGPEFSLTPNDRGDA